MKTLGDHIRKKRLDLGLLQEQVAEQIGVTKDAIYLWESNTRTPSLSYIPRIIQFLGYAPYYTLGRSFPEKLKMCRTLLGMSQEQLAKILGVDVSTLANWEKGQSHPTAESIKVIEKFFTQTAPSFVKKLWE